MMVEAAPASPDYFSDERGEFLVAVAVGRVAIAAITTVTPVWRGQRASADRTRVAKSGNPLMEGLTTSAEV